MEYSQQHLRIGLTYRLSMFDNVTPATRVPILLAGLAATQGTLLLNVAHDSTNHAPALLPFTTSLSIVAPSTHSCSAAAMTKTMLVQRCYPVVPWLHLLGGNIQGGRHYTLDYKDLQRGGEHGDNTWQPSVPLGGQPPPCKWPTANYGPSDICQMWNAGLDCPI